MLGIVCTDDPDEMVQAVKHIVRETRAPLLHEVIEGRVLRVELAPGGAVEERWLEDDEAAKILAAHPAAGAIRWAQTRRDSTRTHCRGRRHPGRTRRPRADDLGLPQR